MEESIQSSLLFWIGEEVEARSADDRPGAVPVHILQVKMAVRAKEASSELTQSTEIALKIFDRSELYRALREMVSRDEIAFVDERGNEKQVDENKLNKHASGETSGQLFVSLTENGLPIYLKLKEALSRD